MNLPLAGPTFLTAHNTREATSTAENTGFSCVWILEKQIYFDKHNDTERETIFRSIFSPNRCGWIFHCLQPRPAVTFRDFSCRAVCLCLAAKPSSSHHMWQRFNVLNLNFHCHGHMQTARTLCCQISLEYVFSGTSSSCTIADLSRLPTIYSSKYLANILQSKWQPFTAEKTFDEANIKQTFTRVVLFFGRPPPHKPTAQ